MDCTDCQNYKPHIKSTWELRLDILESKMRKAMFNGDDNEYNKALGEIEKHYANKDRT